MALTNSKQRILDSIASTNNNKSSSDSEKSSVFFDSNTGEKIASGYQNIIQPNYSDE